MRSYVRAVRMALRYRYSLLGATLCSLMIGVLWGANIGTLYPFVEIVFRGESLQKSLAHKLDVAERNSAELESNVADLRRQIGALPADQREDLQRQVELKEVRLAAEQRAVASVRRYQPLVDKYLPDDPFLTLAIVIAAMGLGTLLKSLFLVISEVLVSWVTFKTTFDLQNRFYERTLRLDTATFSEDRASMLMSCLTHRVQALSGSLNALFGQAVREPLKLIVCLIGAGIISWRLLLLSLLVTPIGGYLLRLLTKAIKRGSNQEMSLMSEVYKRLSETFFGIVAVKAFTGEDQERARFRETTTRLLSKRRRRAVFLALTKPVSEIMGVGIISVAVLTSSYLVLHRETHLFGIRISDQPLSPAALMVFYGLLAGVADPARKLSGIYARIILGAAAAQKIFKLMDREPGIQDPPHPKPIPRPHRELIFDKVRFFYQSGEPVLRNIELQIPFGEKIALVGPNGCGKSTMAKLLARFHDPTAESICLDGVDLRQYRLGDLRRQIGLVTQDTWLFDDTIMNNIRYGRPDATDREVLAASRKAHAHEFITEKLEEGYKTVVGERGGRLSGGQRQRISLARAILRDPAILILDEATSEIDLESEKLIHKVLAKFMRDRTAIMITHRLSTLELADRIAVMDRGRILDVGTHDELMSRCKPYQRLRMTEFGEAA